MAQRILLPVDGSIHSDQALEYVVSELTIETVIILHVIDPLTILQTPDAEYLDLETYQRAQDERREAAERMVEQYRTDAEARGIDSDIRIAVGRPVERIIETAEDEGVDHIVMGSRGRSGIGRMIFGSVAEGVTRRAPVPVTVIRNPGDVV